MPLLESLTLRTIADDPLMDLWTNRHRWGNDKMNWRDGIEELKKSGGSDGEKAKIAVVHPPLSCVRNLYISSYFVLKNIEGLSWLKIDQILKDLATRFPNVQEFTFTHIEGVKLDELFDFLSSSSPVPFPCLRNLKVTSPYREPYSMDKITQERPEVKISVNGK